jgi:hypothetical protein
MVLHEFLQTNRNLLIDRCRHMMVVDGSEPKSRDQEEIHGIPVFLDQLIKILRVEEGAASVTGIGAREIGVQSDSEVGDLGMLHGRDLLDQGFTIEQVVRDYGNVCQAVTNLAFDTGAPIAVEEFRTLNRCLDNAIAGAVREYARQTAQTNTLRETARDSRLGALAQELLHNLQTATLVLSAIKRGSVGVSGATAGVLDRSLTSMRSLIDQALAEASRSGPGSSG